MLERDLTTVDLVWRADPLTFYARNPFPVDIDAERSEIQVTGNAVPIEGS